MKRVTAQVVFNDEVMPGVFLTWLESAELAASARPGQFVMVLCGEDTLLRRPLSIHQVDGDRLALLFAAVGKGTQWLAARQEGQEIDLMGPLGNGFLILPDSRNLLLIAGGMGIAPLRFLADEAASGGRGVTFLYGTPGDRRCELPNGVTAVPATDDGSVGYRGMITDLIPEHIGRADQVFACGPPAMYRDIASRPEMFGGKPVQVSLEMRMGCGTGVCYACTIRTRQGLKQVCRDGPVFELGDILWDEMTVL